MMMIHQFFTNMKTATEAYLAPLHRCLLLARAVRGSVFVQFDIKYDPTVNAKDIWYGLVVH